MHTIPVQRLRIVFEIQSPLSYASVLDISKVWERLLRRAGIPLCYTQGFNPHPRMQFAAALATGYTSSAEVLDLWIGNDIAPDDSLRRLQVQCPDGLRIQRVDQVDLNAASPQAALLSMRYRVAFRAQASAEETRQAVSTLLAQDQVWIERVRKGQVKRVDLRPFVLEMAYISSGQETHVLELELAFRADGSIRPEEALSALPVTIEQLRIHRTALRWQES